MYSKIKSSGRQRVELNEEILKKILKRISSGRISEMADDIGLPYDLIYNLVHGRINSLSAENYKLIFGEEPPKQAVKRVDGSYFRKMVQLWLYLNDDVSEADLYRELYRNKNVKRVDYRIFSEVTQTVEKKVEQVMEQKFIDQGFDRFDIKELTRELNLIERQERVLYEDIRPVLSFLAATLEINPTRILNQWYVRYEDGELKTVSKKVYDDALELKKRAENALDLGSRYEVEKIREEIYGKKRGYVLFSEIEEELEFLRKFGAKNPRQYLGRSVTHYKKSRLKRIALWRALKIKNACRKLIDDQPEIALTSLPNSHRKKRLKKLLTVLKLYSISKVIKDEENIERSILMPAHYHEQYHTNAYGLISLNKAGYFLGMSKIAFDLLVSENLDVFRRIGKYNKEWYLPYLYLKKIKEKNGFDIVKAKYEMLAQKYKT
ncbi:MAG: hypothetical protein JRE65_04520 [Deltaproteobacteria bacterium]|jgi:hypothetical protein|nr:hypothetical protein [Deltaproteobacteria bacterium]